MKAQLKTQERVWWGQLQNDYYLGGRILILTNQFHAGYILLGYAIEAHFKQALNEIRFKAVKHHKLSVLYDLCQSNGLFTDVLIPKDFIEYAEYLIEARYPIQVKESSKKLSTKNRTMVREVNIMFCYDEVIQKLERSLFNFTNDHTSSVFFRLYAGIDREANWQGLYYNGAGLKNFILYRDMISEYAPSNTAAIELLNTKSESYFWSPQGKTPYATFDIELSEKYLSKFRLPGNIERDSTGMATIIEFSSPFSRR